VSAGCPSNHCTQARELQPAQDGSCISGRRRHAFTLLVLSNPPASSDSQRPREPHLAAECLPQQPNEEARLYCCRSPSVRQTLDSMCNSFCPQTSLASVQSQPRSTLPFSRPCFPAVWSARVSSRVEERDDENPRQSILHARSVPQDVPLSGQGRARHPAPARASIDLPRPTLPVSHIPSAACATALKRGGGSLKRHGP
jgi:hypothetical protein